MNWDPPSERRIFSCEQLRAEGHTRSELRCGSAAKLFTPVIHGVYIEGAEPPSAFDEALARMVRMGEPAWGLVAARLYDLDAVHDLDPPPVKRRRVTDLGGEPRVAVGHFARARSR